MSLPVLREHVMIFYLAFYFKVTFHTQIGLAVNSVTCISTFSATLL